MGITDELRKWVRDGKGSLLAIADRIDAEHEKAMSRAGELLDDAEEVRDYNYSNWQECKQKVRQHNITMGELSAEIKRLEDELSHCVELPVDAEGVPIRIGDVLTDDAEFKSEGVVKCLMLDERGWFVGFGNGWADTTLHEWHHHHAPTVEDVLCELLDKVDDDRAGQAEIIAEYAGKLQLKEGA